MTRSTTEQKQAYKPGYRFTGIVMGATFNTVEIARGPFTNPDVYEPCNLVHVRFENPYGKFNAGDRIRVRVDRFYAGSVIPRSVEIIPFHDVETKASSWRKVT